MTGYDNTNKGAIWKNDQKETDSQPHFKGKVNAGGVDYWVAAWKRAPGASSTSPALKFALTPCEKQPVATQPADVQEPEPEIEDDIPF